MKLQCSPCGYVFDAYHHKTKYVNPFDEEQGFYCPACMTKLESPKMDGRAYLYYCLANTNFKPGAVMSVGMLVLIGISALINVYLFVVALACSIVFLGAKATNKQFIPAILCKKSWL